MTTNDPTTALSSSTMTIPSTHTYGGSNSISLLFTDYTPLFEHLLSIGQALCGQVCGTAERLSEEVVISTQGSAQLLFSRQHPLERIQPVSSTISISLPVRFNNLVYGMLCVTHDLRNRPILPFLFPLPNFWHIFVAGSCIPLNKRHLYRGNVNDLTYRHRVH